MKKNRPKSVQGYLQGEHQALQMLFAKVKELTTLNTHLKPLLEPTVAPYCQVANRTGNKLVLLVATSAAATQLRFQIAELLKKCSADPILKTIQHIEYKVRPVSLPTTVPTASPMALPSTETAGVIEEMAETIQDPALKIIMKKIAGRRKKNPL